ncbi:hypothetical protein Cni_G07799 [Canna indica]|uniref:ARM repeat superfamily protein n=1 Tax=Canna indica TaxID=4628 RepID=A0AAQ3JZI1_9LILI|nr:hypothetical protein Cni_G07799 [Canna indica]
MQATADARATAELLSGLLDSVDEIASLAPPPEAESSSSHHRPSPLSPFAALVSRLNPILSALLLLQQEQQQPEPADSPGKMTALASLGVALRRARSLAARSAGASATPVAGRLLEGAARALGSGLGVLAGAWADAPVEIRAEMEVVQGKMMNARFDSPAQSKGGSARVDVEDLVADIKNVDEDELWVVMFEIEVLIGEGLVVEEGGRLIPALLNRLATTKSENRLKMIIVLRSLASYCNENKVEFNLNFMLFSICPQHVCVFASMSYNYINLSSLTESILLQC